MHCPKGSGCFPDYLVVTRPRGTEWKVAMNKPQTSGLPLARSGSAQGIASNTVLDRRVLEELRQYSDDSQDLVEELVTLFLADSPLQLMALQQALRDANWGEVERRSHRLKGSAGSIGAERLRELCQEIEEYARRGELAMPEEASTAVSTELEALKQELKTLQSSPNG